MRKSSRLLVVVPIVALVGLVAYAPAPVSRVSYSAFTTASWPFLKLASVVRDKWFAAKRYWTDQRDLRRENVLLQSQVQALDIAQISVAQMRVENERLKKLLDFKQSLIPQAVAARVLGYDPSGWTQSLLIDKGTHQRIALNQAVICAQGVVGKIAQVGPMVSKVLLLVDRHIRIGAMLEDSRDAGILEGHGPRRCRVLYLPRDSAIALGQKVLTSGLGGIFPKGLLLGKVVGVSLDEMGLYQIADIEPAVPISKLEEVTILQGAES